VQVRILEFAKDIVFITKTCLENIFTVKSLLGCFELVSGLKINFHESTIGELGIEQHDMERYSKVMNYNRMGVPFMYLGMVVGGNPRKQEL